MSLDKLIRNMRKLEFDKKDIGNTCNGWFAYKDYVHTINNDLKEPLIICAYTNKRSVCEYRSVNKDYGKFVCSYEKK